MAPPGEYINALYEYNLAVVKLNKATGAYKVALPGAETPQEKKAEKAG